LWRPGRRWFEGLALRLRALAEAAVQRGAHLVQGAEGIVAMTDKSIARERLLAAGVPVPDGALAPPTPEMLRELMEARRWSQVFVKPRWGSSGAGVIALRRSAHRSQAEERAETTLRLGPGGLANHKRLCVHRDRAAIDALLAPILADGAIVERWIPKLGTARGPFDLRLLTIAGELRHRVARVGRGTITNLHLDAGRLDVDEALEDAPLGTFAAVVRVCEQAAAVFSDCLYVGVDLALDQEFRPWVLEVNAWGDHLPRLLDRGVESYDAELAAC
jgi:hypothetical protein